MIHLFTSEDAKSHGIYCAVVLQTIRQGHEVSILNECTAPELISKAVAYLKDKGLIEFDKSRQKLVICDGLPIHPNISQALYNREKEFSASYEFHQLMDIETSKEKYFSLEEMKGSRDRITMRLHVDEEILSDWADLFCDYKIRTGEPKKSIKDFAQNFANWLNKQDLSQNPKLLLHEQGINKKADRRTGKVQTGANVDTDSAIEKLSRMS